MDLSEVQNVQGMGGLMYQQAQWLMKQMQDNPELIIVPKCLTKSPEEIPAGASGPDSINPGNNNRSNNPDSTRPPVGLPAGATIQPEVGSSISGSRHA
jgi:hypothetical protein